MADPAVGGETIGKLSVLVDLPSSSCSSDDCKEEADQGEDTNNVMQLDVHVHPGCLTVIEASAPCQAILAPLEEGMNFLERMVEGDMVMNWLNVLHQALVFNQAKLPICERFGRVQVIGSASTLEYIAILDVFFPPHWSPRQNVVSFRLWPDTGQSADLQQMQRRKTRRERRRQRSERRPRERKGSAAPRRDVPRLRGASASAPQPQDWLELLREDSGSARGASSDRSHSASGHSEEGDISEVSSARSGISRVSL
mmetsp:Transcript_53343/g.100315  ORF Transcript_53343/g.100315 Transcript_53343/m.100315 type:complete len:255 (+) Transcript_53343:57-821(+)